MRKFTVHAFTAENPNDGMNSGVEWDIEETSPEKAIEKLIGMCRLLDQGTRGWEDFSQMIEFTSENDDYNVSAYRLDNTSIDWKNNNAFEMHIYKDLVSEEIYEF